MILKYILSPIVRNWEFSDFFIGTDLLFSNYEKENTDDEINRCKLLETLQQASYLESKENQELFDKFYSTYFDKEFVSQQETIALEELINNKQIKFGSTPIELNINKIILKIIKIKIKTINLCFKINRYDNHFEKYFLFNIIVYLN